MRLVSISLRGEYKGLKDQVFDFHRANEGVIALIGLNGAGKSLLMELLAEAFAYLERYARKDFVTKTPLPFSLVVEFCRAENEYSDKAINLVVEILDSGEVLLDGELALGSEELSFLESILPDYIVGYSSGLNENLQRAFMKNAVQFYEIQRVRSRRNKEITKKIDYKDLSDINLKYLKRYPHIFGDDGLFDEDALFSLAEADTALTRMVYLDYDNLALLVLCLAVLGEQPIFSHGGLRIRGVRSVRMSFDFSGGVVDEDVVKDIKLLMRAAGEEKVAFSGAINSDAQYDLYEMDYLSGTIELDLSDTSVRESLSEMNYDRPDKLFCRLHKMQMLGVKKWPASSRSKLKHDCFIGTVKKPLKVHAPLMVDELVLEDGSGRGISLDDISDGEVQLIQMMAAARIFGARESLFLLDEPETHLNPAWRVHFHSIIKRASEQVLPGSSTFLVSTHSPFMISSLKRESVLLFTRQQDGTVCSSSVDSQTFGASFEVLVKKYFGLKSLISESAIQEVRERIEAQNLDSETAELREWVEKSLGESMEKAYLLERLK